VRRLAALLALLLAAFATAGCAASGSAQRHPESPSALARPEPDPVDHGTPRDRLLVSGTEQVTIAAAADVGAAPRVARVLAPELTVAQADDVRRANPALPWAPPPEFTSFRARIANLRLRGEPPPAR
jgi:hypothetical protein